MSIQHCRQCDQYIDTDYDAEHFYEEAIQLYCEEYKIEPDDIYLPEHEERITKIVESLYAMPF